MVSSTLSDIILSKFTTSTSQVVCQVTPDFAIVEAYPNPRISRAGHVCLVLTYVVLAGSYASFIMYQWATRPYVQTVSQSPSLAFGGYPLLVTATCTNAPNCGDTSIVANYTTDTPAACPFVPMVVLPAAQSSAANSLVSLNVSLCFTGAQVYSTADGSPLTIPGIIVDYTAVNSGKTNASRLAEGIVSIYDGNTGAMIRSVTMETWQVKTLLLGATVTMVDGAVTSTAPYPIAVQYEGRRPVSRATLVIAMAPYVNVVSSTRTGTISILSEIGAIFGGSMIVCFLLSYGEPLVTKVFPGPASDACKAGHAVDNSTSKSSNEPAAAAVSATDGDEGTKQRRASLLLAPLRSHEVAENHSAEEAELDVLNENRE